MMLAMYYQRPEEEVEYRALATPEARLEYCRRTGQTIRYADEMETNIRLGIQKDFDAAIASRPQEDAMGEQTSSLPRIEAARHEFPQRD